MISDWNMAPMTGLQLLQEVRADARLKHAVHHDHRREQDRERRRREAGRVSNYIVKPFNAETLGQDRKGPWPWLTPTDDGSGRDGSRRSARASRRDPEMVADVVRAVLATMSGDLSAQETSLLAEVEALGRTIGAPKRKSPRCRWTTSRIHIPFATDELDAIVEHTASATNAILESCEMLDEVAGQPDRRTAAKLQDATTRSMKHAAFRTSPASASPNCGDAEGDRSEGRPDHRHVRQR